eukprot:TRINITY_DN1432_c0_g1_i2.p1 TRINITY_DN1432_c0_g1~~TRINITY_DN1432_c0_g1_i2.p1  ORF type:complete len:255 (-),score=62.79 TRINITY_DN1432_c0_g1_i2:725-1489(-)
MVLLSVKLFRLQQHQPNPMVLRLMLLGAPGSGKGTFAKLLAPHYGASILSTGDLVRAEIKAGSDLGKQIKHLNASGNLVPDDLITSMLRKALEALPSGQRIKSSTGKGGFILDGFPRTVPQAQQLASFQQLDIVLNLTLPEEVLVTKAVSRRVCSSATCGKGYNVAHIKLGEIDMPPLLPKREGICDKCGSTLVQRDDDTEEIVKSRLKVYNEQTFPLIEFYRAASILVEFPLKKGIDDFPRLIQELEARYKRN